MISFVQLIVTFDVKLRRSDLFYFLFLFKWADSQTSNQVGWFNPNLMSRTNPKISSQEKWRLSFLLGIDFSLYSQLYSLCLGAEIEPNILFFFCLIFPFQTEQIRFRAQSEQFNWIRSDQTNTRKKHRNLTWKQKPTI